MEALKLNKLGVVRNDRQGYSQKQLGMEVQGVRTAGMEGGADPDLRRSSNGPSDCVI